jgi:cell division initiation protein
MSYTPVEIRHVRLGRGLLGYRRSQVDRLLDDVVESFETVWRERADHADRAELLEGELTRYRELESLLRATLVSAERASHEVRDQAKREAETIVAEAQAEARAITRKAREEHEALVAEARRLRLILHAALDALDEAEPEVAPTAEDGGETDEEETRATRAA